MKKRIGINELTSAELTSLTPLEKHQQLSTKIPMQADGCLRHVRLMNVPKRLQEGWIFKRQNALQEWKVQMAQLIHPKVQDSSLSLKKANVLLAAVASATAADRKSVERQVKEQLQSLN